MQKLIIRFLLFPLLLFSLLNEGYAQNILNWSSPGSGFDSPVRYITTYQGKPVAAGSFNYSNNSFDSLNKIAYLENNVWKKFGVGFNGDVNSVVVFNGELIAAGNFVLSGNIPVNFCIIRKYTS